MDNTGASVQILTFDPPRAGAADRVTVFSTLPLPDEDRRLTITNGRTFETAKPKGLDGAVLIAFYRSGTTVGVDLRSGVETGRRNMLEGFPEEG